MPGARILTENSPVLRQLLVPEMLKMMSEIEESDDWATTDDSADDDSERWVLGDAEQQEGEKVS